MKITKYLCKIEKGKFKDVEGYAFEHPLFSHNLKISIFDNVGNEYWVNSNSVKFIGREEIEFKESEEN